MNARPPPNRRRHAATVLAAGVAGSALLSGTLLLFDDGHETPGPGLLPSAAAGGPNCGIVSALVPHCGAGGARVADAAASSSTAAP